MLSLSAFAWCYARTGDSVRRFSDNFNSSAKVLQVNVKLNWRSVMVETPQHSPSKVWFADAQNHWIDRSLLDQNFTTHLKIKQSITMIWFNGCTKFFPFFVAFTQRSFERPASVIVMWISGWKHSMREWFHVKKIHRKKHPSFNGYPCVCCTIFLSFKPACCSFEYKRLSVRSNRRIFDALK